MKKIILFTSMLGLVFLSVFAAAKYKPHVYPPDCVGCADCVVECPKRGKAIALVRGKAVINVEECIGCMKCVSVCSYGAVR